MLITVYINVSYYILDYWALCFVKLRLQLQYSDGYFNTVKMTGILMNTFQYNIISVIISFQATLCTIMKV